METESSHMQRIFHVHVLHVLAFEPKRSQNDLQKLWPENRLTRVPFPNALQSVHKELGACGVMVAINHHDVLATTCSHNPCTTKAANASIVVTATKTLLDQLALLMAKY
eukprot:2314186-Amphidinium_carterae.3